MNKIHRYAQDDNVILTVFLIKVALMHAGGDPAAFRRTTLDSRLRGNDGKWHLLVRENRKRQ